ncbi:MAG: ATPase [Candidatus Magnetoglobus multicellularis str. Araruama]|uniref:ATPase n=1 Tax=Candidatus Magnetoglobus multicellularis str. Araruama TaxID=890399 RepID=A0A1V1P613_9BACT|nr:MAG: ATPase [Candidatus Magnetoglobus multicellularis str. Araruama]
MPKKTASKTTKTRKKNVSSKSTIEILRQPAEIQYADQLEALRQNDEEARPKSWQLSPRAVLTYILGDVVLKAKINAKTIEVPITKKFYGDTDIVERAIVTLASERALLLVGDPGTAKSWLSEHLAAAICNDSTLTIQGTAGTTEEHIKYSWNIAQIIAEGPNPNNMILAPTMVAMKKGAILRFEEITRCVPDVQDSLVSILSDKAVSVPELPDANRIDAKMGFNIIATANTRDQGVNELSAALKRRFNYIFIPIVKDFKTEVEIVKQRSTELLSQYGIPTTIEPSVLNLLGTVFREIRNGKTSEGVTLKQTSTVLSTAEAIGVALESAIQAHYFGDNKVTSKHIALNILGSVVKEDLADQEIYKEYVLIVAKKRAIKEIIWKDFYESAMDALK